MPTKRKSCSGRVYLGADADGRERYEWVGRFRTKRERDAAVAARRAEIAETTALSLKRRDDPGAFITCVDYSNDALQRMESGELRSQGRPPVQGLRAIDQARTALRRFVTDFGHRTLADVAQMRKGERAPVGRARRRHGRRRRRRGRLASTAAVCDEAQPPRPQPIPGAWPTRVSGPSEAPDPPRREEQMILLARSVLGARRRVRPALMRALVTVAAFTNHAPRRAVRARLGARSTSRRPGSGARRAA